MMRWRLDKTVDQKVYFILDNNKLFFYFAYQRHHVVIVRFFHGASFLYEQLSPGARPARARTKLL
jgi:hypothetical protein